MPQKIILSVINDLSSDQRMHRIATALKEAGYEVLLLGRQLPDSLPLTKRSYQTHRMKLLFQRGKLFYLEYNFRLFLYLLFQRVQILTANDLDTLLANFLVSKLKRLPLVYDSHEYFTEVPELIDRPLTRRIWLSLEGWIFPRLRHVYTVNEGIANIYSAAYQVEVKVVRNVPFSVKLLPAKQPKNQLLIYQGALNVGRGIELMIAAMAYLPDYVLWIAGGGDLSEELKKIVIDKNLSARVLFYGRIPMEELAPITQQARLGFSLEEDLGANYRLASPNKVFDYIQAAVPVLVSDLPEMKSLITQYRVGEVLEESERNPQQLAARIHQICSNQQLYQTYVANCKAAAQLLNWEREKGGLIAIYDSLLPHSRSVKGRGC